MTQFLRLLAEDDKAQALLETCTRLRAGEADSRHFEVAPSAFDAVPGKPFAYWVSEAVRETFRRLPSFGECALPTSGTGTLDDFRFLRTWWEADGQPSVTQVSKWFPYEKGGAFAPMYFDHYLSINWKDDGAEMKAWIVVRYGGGHWAKNIRSTEHYFRPGLTWPRRTQGGLSLRAMPAGCIFADKGPAAFVDNDDPEELLAMLALTNSRAFALLVSLQMAFGSYEVGVIQKTPVPSLTTDHRQLTTSSPLTTAARRAGPRTQPDTTNETSTPPPPSRSSARTGRLRPTSHPGRAYADPSRDPPSPSTSTASPTRTVKQWSMVSRQ